MSINELARRYGRALWEQAAQHAVRRRVAGELEALAALIGRERRLQECLDDSALPASVKASILDAIIAPAFSPLARNFIGLLARSRRIDLLAGIVQFLAAELDAEEGRVQVMIESARPMTAEDRADCLRRLARWLGKEAALEIKVVPELLAGITIRVGDRLIDGSCRGRLARLRRLLAT